MTDKRVPARFYRTDTGNEPVREWLKQLKGEEKKVIGTDIQTVEYGWPIGMPTCRSMGKGVHEVRSDLPSRRIARVLFCIHDEEMILLHGFIKKTQRTLQADIDLALKRKRKMEQRS